MGILDEKVVVIVGAGGGIGRAVAELFSGEGARLLLNDLGCDRSGEGRDASIASGVAEAIRQAGGEAKENSENASTPEGADRIVQAAMDSFGRIDALVYAAGVFAEEALLRSTDATFGRVFEAHVSGSYFAARQAALAMQRGKHGGRIVLTTGAAGLLGNFGQTAYSAAAAGVYGLMRATSIEMQRRGILVNAVAPLAKTRLTEDLPLFEHVDTMTPAHVAPAYLFFASELSGDLTGNVLAIAGGRISTYRVVESNGRYKETERGPWTAAEIRDEWASMATSRS